MVDMTNDVTRFEAMFSDRFTEKDDKFMELKSKSLSKPIVIYPWKTQKRIWNKRWDYSSNRNQEDRDQRGGERERQRHNYYDKRRDRSQGEGNSRGGYRDREDREYSRDRREYGQRSRREERQDHSQDGHKEKKFDFQAALKAYSESH